MPTCAAASTGSAFITSVISQIDCQAQSLGAGSWAAFGAPGSTLSYVLTGFLTIFIALVGYNLLFGRTLGVRSATLAAVKIGAVLALATSWSAYSTLAYNVVTNGPSELVAEIGPQAGLVGSDGTLTQRLDIADQALAKLAILAASSPQPDPDAQTPPQPFGGFDAFALGGSRILFELTALAAIGGVRLIAAVMLALGPLFITFLMFDTTSSIFSGWVRILAGAALAAIGASIALGLELALLEPWLRRVLALLASGQAVPTAPSELFAIISFFTLTTMGTLWASSRIAAAFSLFPIMQWVTVRSDAQQRAVPNLSRTKGPGAPILITGRRAAVVASAIVATSRRDRSGSITRGSISSGASAITSHSRDEGPAIVPAGRLFTRSAKSRLSAGAAKRDAAG